MFTCFLDEFFAISHLLLTLTSTFCRFKSSVATLIIGERVINSVADKVDNYRDNTLYSLHPFSILPHISLNILHTKLLKVTAVYLNEISILYDKRICFIIGSLL